MKVSSSVVRYSFIRKTISKNGIKCIGGGIAAVLIASLSVNNDDSYDETQLGKVAFPGRIKPVIEHTSPEVARYVPIAGDISPEVALREELFCKLLDLGCIVNPENFERIMLLDSPLDTDANTEIEIGQNDTTIVLTNDLIRLHIDAKSKDNSKKVVIHKPIKKTVMEISQEYLGKSL